MPDTYFKKRLTQSNLLFLVKQLLIVEFYKDLKKSFIGAAWLVFGPLIGVATWVILHSAGVLKPGHSDIPYPAYVLLSTSLWSLFIGIYKSVSNILKANGRILIMVKISDFALVLEKILTELILFFILLLITIFTLFFLDIQIPWTAILLPVTLIPLIMLGTMIGLFNALLRIVAVDLSRLLDNFMGFLMFLTPIVYTPKIKFGLLSEVIKYNPLVQLIEVPRTILTSGMPTSIISWFTISIILISCFPVVWIYYRIKSRYVIERLISI